MVPFNHKKSRSLTADCTERIGGFLPYKNALYLSMYIRFHNNCRRLPETKLHSSLFVHWSGSRFLVSMAACTPSLHVFLGRPLFLLSIGVHSIINFGYKYKFSNWQTRRLKHKEFMETCTYDFDYGFFLNFYFYFLKVQSKVILCALGCI